MRQPFRNEPIAMVAAGEQHALFLTQKGEVYSCGINDTGQLGLGDLNDRSEPMKISFGEVRGIEERCDDATMRCEYIVANMSLCRENQPRP